MGRGTCIKDISTIKKLMARVLILLGMILVCSNIFAQSTINGVTYRCYTDVKTADVINIKSDSTRRDFRIPSMIINDKYSVNRLVSCGSNKEYLRILEIAANLTKGVSSFACYSCPSLWVVRFWGTISTIGDHAFANCRSLGIINFYRPGEIGENAFENDSNLYYVSPPVWVGSIRRRAFANCVNLPNIEIGTVGKIETGAFYHDTAVQYVSIDSLKACDPNAFFGAESQVKTVTINNGVVGDLAFNKQPYLEKVFLGDGITYVGKQAFQDSKSLKDLYLGKKIETIEEEAFAGTAVPNITISQTCKNIGARALDCDNLACLTFEDGNSSVVLDGYAGGEQLQRLYLGRPVVYKNSDAENAFGTTHLKSVTFGANNDDWEKDSMINATTYSQPTYESADLDTVRVLRAIPPKAPKGGFSDYSYNNALLLVPEESVELYQKDPIWGKFAHTGKFSQEISWEQDTIVTCKDIVTLTATASSGLPVQYRITDGSDKAEICQSNGLFQLKVNKSGSVTIEAYQSGDGTYNAAKSVNLRFTVIKCYNKITWEPTTTTMKVRGGINLNASALSDQTVSFKITKGEKLAEITETQGKYILKGKGAGTVTVAAIEQGDDTYAAADTVFVDFTITKYSQTITWEPTQTVLKVGESITLSIFTSSDRAVSFKITKGEELAEIIKNSWTYTLKANKGGYVTVAAIEQGNDIYEAADTVFRVFTIVKYSQKITWTPAQTSIKVGESVALEASASSGQAVSYKITEGEGLAEIVETDGKHYLKANGAGSVTVAAIEPGNGTYAAADSVFKVFTISKYTQTITWTPAQTSLKAGESVTLEATASSGHPVSYKITEGENLAEIVETEGKYALKGKGGGSVTVAAFVQGNELYEATDSIFTTFTITKKEQTITWKQDIEIVKGTTLTMQAVSSSGLPVTYTYQDPRPGTFGIPSSISGADIVFDSPGAYILYANQEGNDEYEAAEPVKMEFNVLDEAYDDLMYIDGIYYRYADANKNSLMVVRGYKKYEGDIVVPTHVNSLPVVKIDNKAFYASYGITSVVVGDNVTNIGEQAFGACKYLTSVTLPPVCSMPNRTYTFNSSPAIKEIHCKARTPYLVDETIFNGAMDYSTCILYVPRGTKELYAAAEVWKNFVNIVEEGERAEQVLTWTQSKASLKTGECILLSATASSGLAATYTIGSGADCAEIIPTDSGYVLMALAEGTVTVVASQAGNNAFNAANSVTMQFTITAKKKQTITWEQDIEIAKGTTLTMQAVSSSGLPVTYTYEHPEGAFGIPTSISGAEIVFDNPGAYILYANQEGNDEYEAAEPVKMEFNVLDEAYDDLMYIDGIYYRYADANKNSLMVVRGYKKYEGDIVVPTHANSLPVVKIDDKAFYASYGINSVVVGDRVTSIGEQALGACQYLSSVTLPPVCSMPNRTYTFNSSPAIKEIHCRAITPYQVDETIFNGAMDYSTCILYVPRGTKELYAAAEEWKNFVNIVEEGERAEQAVTWTQSETALMVGDSLQLSATATSGLPVNYTIVDGNENAEILTEDNGMVLHALKAGEVTVGCYQEGNNIYQPSDTICLHFTINKFTQTIEWHQQQTELTSGDTILLTAKASSGLSVKYKITDGEQYATIEQTDTTSMLRALGAGNVTVAAYQDGNNMYSAADTVTVLFVISAKEKKKQTITWEQNIEIVKGTTLTMQAVSSSGLPVTYTYEFPSTAFGIPTSISGAEIVFDYPGAYILYANQEGNDEYEAAEPVKMEFNVLDEEYDDLMYIDGIYYRYADANKNSLMVVSGYKKYEGDIVVPEYANSLPVVRIDGKAFYASYGINSVVVGDRVTSIGEQALGACQYLTSVTLPPVCSMPNRTYTFNSSPAIKEIHCRAITPYQVDETIFNGAMDYTTCILYVPRGTKELYAAAEVWKNFLNIVEEGERAEQTVTWTQSETALMVGDSLQLRASATSGLTVSYIIVDGNENAEIITTDSGALLHALKAGEVTVAAYQQGNNMYSAADTVTAQFVISAKEKKKQTITWEQNIEIVKGTTLTMQAVSSSGLPVTYTYEHPEPAFGVPASISGAEIVFDYPGAYILYANQEGNDEYEAAEPVKMEFNVLDEAYDDLMYIDGIYYRYADANKNSLMVVSGYKKYEGDIVVPEYANSLPVVRIDGKAFYASYGINSVVVGDRVTSIGEQALGACQYLTSVTLPPVCSMPNRTYTFNSSPAIKEIHCRAITPYQVDETIFNGAMDYATCILYVPRDTKALYEKAEVWCHFTHIAEEDVETGIYTVEYFDSEVDIYTLAGQLVRAKAKNTKGLKPGVYVVRGKKIVAK